MKRLGGVMCVFMLFVSAAIVMTWPLAQHPTRQLPSDLIDTLLNTWILGWDADRFRHGLTGIWDAPVFFPYRNTLAFSENLFGIAIFVAPVYGLTHDAILTYNVAFIASFALAGLGMYLLAGSLTGSAPAALIAGAYFAFCPYRMAQIDHIQMIATGWMPIGLWGLHRYFRTGARWWLSIFSIGCVLQVTSNMYAAYIMAVPVLVILVSEFASSRARLTIARDMAIAVAGVVIVLAPVAFPYYQTRISYRNVRNSVEIEMNSADLRAYASPIDSIGITRRFPGAVPLYGEKAVFTGVFIIVLAAVAIGHALRHQDELRRWSLIYGVTALAAAAISFGPHVRAWGRTLTDHGPYGWLWWIVPGWDGMRVPARFAIIVFLSLSVIAASGATVLMQKLGRPARLVAAATGVLLVLSEAWIVPMRTVPYSRRGRVEDRALTEWLSERPPGAVLDMPMVTEKFEEVHYQYATLLHGHPLVNGMSGYNSGLQRLFRNPDGPLYDWARPAAVVRMLRSIGVRYVAIHPRDYTPAQRAAGEEERTTAQLRESGQIVSEDELHGARVFELMPYPQPSPPIEASPLDRREFTLRVSANEDRAAYLVDNDGDTRWFTEQRGDPFIEASFAAPTDVAAIDLQWAERSLTDYARELTIEADASDGTSKTIYKATPYAEAISGFVRNGFYPTMTVRLPPNRSLRLRIRQTGSVDRARWWSVHEIRLWKRAQASAESIR